MRKICCAALLIGLTACGDGLPPQYELVQNCRAPMFRRAKESIVRRKVDGKLFYRDRHNSLMEIDSASSAKQVCKRP